MSGGQIANTFRTLAGGWLAYPPGVEFYSLHCLLFGSIGAVLHGFQNRARCRLDFKFYTHLLDMADLLCSIGELPLTLRARCEVYYVGRSAIPTSSIAIHVVNAPGPRPAHPNRVNCSTRLTPFADIATMSIKSRAQT
jgi:hypothetical protein